jgi:predicted Rossmann fold nucleotide-binding protein DprA/Smf involved in DNA uptake
MQLNENTQAALLLTVHFLKDESQTVNPLTPVEWGRFAYWLNQNGKQPGDLLSGGLKDILKGWVDKTVTFERVEELLNRGMAMGVALEKWQRAGLWVITRSDSEYPKKLKERLQKNSPPLFFGAGKQQLLHTPALAVVGSRHANEDELQYTRELGRAAAEQGYSVISGGARGVDENAMLGALEAGGTSIGILSGSLFSAISSKKYRQYINNGDLVLISPYNPESGFNIGNAMGRNKYIYCLADAAVVVRADDNKGGTWNGALENLRRNWAPLWVAPFKDPESGNQNMIKKGGAWLDDVKPENLQIAALLKREKRTAQELQPSFPELASVREAATKGYSGSNAEKAGVPQSKTPGDSSLNSDMSLYRFFCRKITTLLRQKSQTAEELEKELDLLPAQLEKWLEQAVKDGIIHKNTRPLRYSLKPASSTGNLFE